MILKHSFKSVVRTPKKSILFLLLLIVLTLFLCIGVGMYDSARNMLLDADQTFTSLVELDYLGEIGEDKEAFFNRMNAELENFDFSPLENHKSVKTVGRDSTAWAYIEGDAIKRSDSPLRGYVMIKISSIKEYGENMHRGVVDETLFGNRVKNNTYVLINDMDEQGVLQNNNLIPGHQYLIIGKLTDGRTPTPIIHPEVPGETGDYPSIVDLKENPDFLESDLGKQMMDLHEAISIVDQSLDVTLVSSLEASRPYYSGELLLKEGRIFQPSEYQKDHNRVVLISETVADFYQVGVGDSLPLKLHYSKSGFGVSEYLTDREFACEGSYTIVGIFENKEDSKHTLYIPEDDWSLQKFHSTDLAGYIVKNGTGEDYIEDLEKHLPSNMKLTLYDQGYEEAVKPIITLKNNAILIIVLGALSGAAILTLFAYLYIIKQKNTLNTMLSLGSGKRRTMGYILYGSMLLVFCACVVGAFLSLRIQEEITQLLFDGLKTTYVTDVRYSERNIGLQMSFIPQLRTNGWLPVFVTAAVLLISLIVLISFTYSIMQGEKEASLRKEKKKEKPIIPRKTQVKKMMFGRIRPITLKFTLISLVRSAGRSLIVPIISLILSSFILFLGLLSNKQQEELDTVYDRVPVTAYMTTYKDEKHEVSGLDLQYDIYSLISPELILPQEEIAQSYTFVIPEIGAEQEFFTYYFNLYSMFDHEKSQSDRTMHLDSSEYFEEMYLYTAVHYEYMGISMTKDGEVNKALPIQADIRKHKDAEGFDWFLNAIARMPRLAYADDLRYTPDFFNDPDPKVAFLEGYSYDSLRLGDNVGIISQNLAGTYGIENGDTIRITGWFEDKQAGAFCVINFKVIGIYENEWRSDTIYLPWCMSYDHIYCNDLLSSVSEDETSNYVSIDNQLIASRVKAATFLLKNTEELSAFRDSLFSQGYSMVGIIRSNRRALVIQDKALEDTIQNLKNHIRLIETVKPIMLILFGIIGFIISYLLIKHRLNELAIMRSMGAKKRQVFFSFFLEQLFLLLTGLIPALVYALILPDKVILYGASLIYFILCYLFGTALALIIMNRAKILDILFTKE